MRIFFLSLILASSIQVLGATSNTGQYLYGRFTFDSVEVGVREFETFFEEREIINSVKDRLQSLGLKDVSNVFRMSPAIEGYTHIVGATEGSTSVLCFLSPTELNEESMGCGEVRVNRKGEWELFDPSGEKQGVLRKHKN